MKKLHHHLKTTEGKFVLGLIILIVGLFAYYFYATSGVSTVANKDIVISTTDHVRGKPDAKLTLVEFGDFQCPACAAYEPLVPADNKDVLKVVFRHFPLTQMHQNALMGAKAAEAAGMQGKFWEMHDMLYDKQKEWSLGLNARDIIMGYAVTLKLDTKKFSDDLNSKAIEDKILAELKEGTQLDVQGTPTFFLNGRRLENPQSLEAFDKIIREAAVKTGGSN